MTTIRILAGLFLLLWIVSAYALNRNGYNRTDCLLNGFIASCSIFAMIGFAGGLAAILFGWWVPEI